jgi:hypothetical protein
LGNNSVLCVYASGSNLYAGTSGGLGVSTDGGGAFTNTATTRPSGTG